MGFVLLQPEASRGGEGATGAPGPFAPGGCAVQMGLLSVMIVVFYFLMIRPQQKQQQAQDDMLKSLRKGTFVRTRGGIRGEVMDLTENEVFLLIADKVKINVLRSHIASVEPDPSALKAKGKG